MALSCVSVSDLTARSITRGSVDRVSASRFAALIAAVAPSTFACCSAVRCMFSPETVINFDCAPVNNSYSLVAFGRALSDNSASLIRSAIAIGSKIVVLPSMTLLGSTRTTDIPGVINWNLMSPFRSTPITRPRSSWLLPN